MTTQQESKLAWLLALAADSAPESVAETHAVVSGLLCGQPDQDEEALATHLAALQVGDWTSQRILDQLGPALSQLKSELASEDMDFRLLLPTEDRPLEERTRCLAHWCSGFLTGFGATGPTIRSEEAGDALRMIEQIARAATDAESDQEAEEGAYVELVEFVRMAILLLREECRTGATRH
ncbi:MAG: UPF0149 family protein [Gammaproteobacteria bacterium]|jgi:uncharacterized protein YgfB (UPF0149 family)|nr:UPF0149 family protein [Gammaproteobacteria bacterium]